MHGFNNLLNLQLKLLLILGKLCNNMPCWYFSFYKIKVRMLTAIMFVNNAKLQIAQFAQALFLAQNVQAV